MEKRTWRGKMGVLDGIRPNNNLFIILDWIQLLGGFGFLKFIETYMFICNVCGGFGCSGRDF